MTLTKQQVQDAIAYYEQWLINFSEQTHEARPRIDTVLAALRAYEVGSDEPVAWRDAFDEARDIILNERGPIAENGMTNDQINDVLSVLDDGFMPILKRTAPSHVAPTKGDPGDIKRGNAEMHRPESKVTYAIAGKEV